MTQEAHVHGDAAVHQWTLNCSKEDRLYLAYRLAMRVLPLFLAELDSDRAKSHELDALPILRLILATGAGVGFSGNVRSDLVRYAPDDKISAPGGTAMRASWALSTAHDAMRHTEAQSTIEVLDVLHSAGSTLSGDPTDPLMLKLLEVDINSLIDGRKKDLLPLWHGRNAIDNVWNESVVHLRRTPGGDFWIDWYQRALDGREQNWPLLRDVALIDDALWQEGGEALDRRINEIRAEHAIAATANGEQIEVNPDSGKLRLVPTAALPDDTATYVHRKIIKAVEVFDGQAEQAYGGLTADLTMLRRTVEDAANLPVELFDACAAATRRLQVRIKNGDCPSPDQDALIEDYRNRLQEAGADILASDPETRKVLERRAAIIGNDALIEAGEAIRETVEAIEPLLEGALAVDLSRDAVVATDSGATGEDRAVASYRLAGRMLRIEKAIQFAKDTGKGFGLANSHIAKAGGYLKAIEYLGQSPVVKFVKDMIFRWLGF